MSEFKIPTTAGSIIKFDGWEDVAKTTKARYIITLVPGGIDPETGELIDLVWTDAYGPDGGLMPTNEEILAGNPELVFEASAPGLIAKKNFYASDERAYGATVILDSPIYGENSVATFTPGAMDEKGEVIEAFWTNSYGAYFSQQVINDYAYTLIVKGLGRN